MYINKFRGGGGGGGGQVVNKLMMLLAALPLVEICVKMFLLPITPQIAF